MTIFKYTLVIASILLIIACKKHVKDIPAPEIHIKMPEGGFEIDQDTTFILSPKITYDVSSSYEWVLNGEIIATTLELTLEQPALGTYSYFFTVTTPSGMDTMTIPVHSLDIITFETYDQLNDKGYNNNPLDGYYSFKQYDRFSNDNPGGLSDNWSGFSISNNTDKGTATVENEFSVYASSGAEDSKLFSVYKQSDNINHRISFTDAEHEVHSIEVNNTTYAYLTMQNGLIFDKKDNIDYFKLTIFGYDSEDNLTGSVDFYLADYRFETVAERYLVSNWNKIDLTPLGSVKSIGFELSSSIDDDPEAYLPKYFCMDNLKIKS